jgi:hypothetical protein
LAPLLRFHFSLKSPAPAFGQTLNRFGAYFAAVPEVKELSQQQQRQQGQYEILCVNH